jgi:hypothetical protein
MHKSMIGMFDRCPRQYEFRYVEGLRIPPASAMVIGTGVHGSAELDLRSKRDIGLLLPDDAIRDAARDSLNAAWDKEGVNLDDEEKLLGEKIVRGEAVAQTIALAVLHHKELAPVLLPKHIERPFTVELKGFPVDLSGTIDLQESNGTVRDLKTRKASPPDGLADASLDLSCYGLAAKALDGASPPKLAMDFLVKNKNVKLVTQETTRSEAAYRAFLMRVEVVSRAIESGIFPPCSPDNWACSRRFCGFFSRCPWGASGRVSV